MKKIQVYLAGDSTVQTYEKDESPQAGWGQYIDQYCKRNIIFHNHAIGGRSTKTFVEESRLDAILEEISANDYLLIQMGHNDSSINRPERYTEPSTTYKQYLRLYIDGARKKHAIPILITPVGRLHVVHGKFINDFPNYCQAMKEVAEEKNVPLIDLNYISLNYFTSIGYEAAEKLFMISVDGEDCTHYTEAGAEKVAEMVAKELMEMISEEENF
ncbi:rhamnogalacturonan acetylesterase [Lederbergia lenta]|uniref:Carbohydrate esterase, family 12 YesY n=1 Tax=Lederbergia lenta TaxID=1467 RepID=A0A2X4WGQ7_LEDLE|nr:rhamnogalacturonan acetylesterase [Lederbergia lenta]MEC2324614.1 rhamnogalacturonan acetylesterase [Lederbergia lenta]SQI59078.1 carbohydrate esterase, family 12 YesY [Lederbergia lenta]